MRLFYSACFVAPSVQVLCTTKANYLICSMTFLRCVLHVRTVKDGNGSPDTSARATGNELCVYVYMYAGARRLVTGPTPGNSN